MTLSAAEPARHFLYAITDSRQFAVKIGVAKNPRERLRTLQTASPYRLDCVALWQFPERHDAESAEMVAHKLCSFNRMRGEWFGGERLAEVTV